MDVGGRVMQELLPSNYLSMARPPWMAEVQKMQEQFSVRGIRLTLVHKLYLKHN